MINIAIIILLLVVIVISLFKLLLSIAIMFLIPFVTEGFNMKYKISQFLFMLIVIIMMVYVSAATVQDINKCIKYIFELL